MRRRRLWRALESACIRPASPPGVRRIATLPALVASRQEEKEQRRQERLVREEAARKASARRKRLQYVFGGLLGVAVVVGIVAVLALGLGKSDSGGTGKATGCRKLSRDAQLPAHKTGAPKPAAQAAGCH